MTITGLPSSLNFRIHSMNWRLGIVLCGGSKSGKSTIVSTLIESLRQLVTQTSKESSLSYKQEHINVLAVPSLDQMFGHVNSADEWVDGVFTVVMKKANQKLIMHKLSTWITLDGPLCEGWCLYLESLLNESKVCTLEIETFARTWVFFAIVYYAKNW